MAATRRCIATAIDHGKTGGVFVHQNGLGALEDNEIFANAFAGVAIKRWRQPDAAAQPNCRERT